MNAPQVKLMELRQYKSDRTGATYFSGYLGNARVIVMRDDRAECTGKEVARWAVLVEPQLPRESRPAADTRPLDGRGASAGSREPRRPNGRPERTDRREQVAQSITNSAANRGAHAVMSDVGVTPDAPMIDDDVPF